MSVKAVKREVHLSERGLAQQFMPIFRDQRPICGDVDLEAFLMTDIEQLINFGMEKRFSFDVQVNVIGVRFDLIQPFRKVFYFNKAFAALRWRTKGTGEIAHAGDFYIDFLKCFQDVFPIPDAYD